MYVCVVCRSGRFVYIIVYYFPYAPFLCLRRELLLLLLLLLLLVRLKTESIGGMDGMAFERSSSKSSIPITRGIIDVKRQLVNLI